MSSDSKASDEIKSPSGRSYILGKRKSSRTPASILNSKLAKSAFQDEHNNINVVPSPPPPVTGLSSPNLHNAIIIRSSPRLNLLKASVSQESIPSPPQVPIVSSPKLQKPCKDKEAGIVIRNSPRLKVPRKTAAKDAIMGKGKAKVTYADSPDNSSDSDEDPELKRALDISRYLAHNQQPALISHDGRTVVRKKVMGAMKSHFDTLSSRNSPKALFIALKKLSKDQKKAVIDIGFGSILDWNIQTLPRNLSHFVVQSFEAGDCSLKLSSLGKEIPLVVADVKRVFGLPDCGVPIVLPSRVHNFNLLAEFRAQYREPSNNTTLKPSEICKKIVDCDAGDDMFKRNFVMLFYTLVIESQGCGVMSMRPLDLLDDISKIKDYNWCQLIFDLAIKHKVQWSLCSKSEFRGPVLFLLLCYVDRVMVLNKPVPRDLPLIKVWRTSMLKSREADEMLVGAFGKGKILPVSEPALQPETTQPPLQPETCCPIPKECLGDGTIPDFVLQQYNVVRQIANNIREFYNNIEIAPVEHAQNTFFKKFNEECTRLLKIKLPTTVVGDDVDASGNLDDSDERFWSDPIVFDMIEEVEKAIAAEKKVTEHVSMPTDAGPSNSFNDTVFHDAVNDSFEVPLEQPPNVFDVSMDQDLSSPTSVKLVESEVSDVPVIPSEGGDSEVPVEQSAVASTLGQSAVASSLEQSVVAVGTVADCEQSDPSNSGLETNVIDLTIDKCSMASLPSTEEASNVTLLVEAKDKEKKKKMPRFSGLVARRSPRFTLNGEGNSINDPITVLLDSPPLEICAPASTVSSSFVSAKSVYDSEKSDLAPINMRLSVSAFQFCTIPPAFTVEVPFHTVSQPASNSVNPVVPKPYHRATRSTGGNFPSQRTMRPPQSLNDRFRDNMASMRAPRIRETSKSPWLERHIYPDVKPNAKERRLFQWVSQGRNEKEVIFSHAELKLTCRDFHTFCQARFCSVDTKIVDVWARVLNFEELKRCESSIYRFFASTKVCDASIQQVTVTDPDAMTVLFEKQIRVEFMNLKLGVYPLEFGLFVFPISTGEHIFVVTFNMKSKKCELLDPCTNPNFNHTCFAEQLKTVFALYFKHLNLPTESEMISKMEISKPRLPIYGGIENRDLAFFAMYNMDTYMGSGLKDWKYRLINNNASHITTLKIRYLNKIVNTCPPNDQKMANIVQGKCITSVKLDLE